LVIFISGSSGIIGKQLKKRLNLIYTNATIYELIRKEDNTVENSIIIDLLNIDAYKIDLLFNNYKPSLFFHLAWCTNHSDYLVSTENILWEKLTISLINSFYNSGGHKFIGIGSSIEYDWKNNTTPYHERTTSLNGNNWIYGLSKINVFKHLSSLKNISYQWGRVFFVFGPGQTRNRLIPLIIENALNNSDTLSINLNLSRDYISTFEIANQIALMSTTSYSGSFNICSGRSILLDCLVSKIETFTNRKVTISANKYNDNFEVEDIYGSQDVIKLYLPNYNYSEFDFDEDLKKTIKYYK
jgi:UDP-glucuronate decarboxylase